MSLLVDTCVVIHGLDMVWKQNSCSLGRTPAPPPAEPDALQGQSHLHVQLWHQPEAVNCSGSHWQSIHSAAGEKWGHGSGKRSRSLGWQENLDSLTKPPQSQLKGHSPCACAWPDNRNHHRKVQVPANTYNFFEGVREWQVFQFLWQQVPDVKNRLYICQLNSPSSQLYLVFYFYQLTCTALQEKQHPRLQNCRRAKWALPSGLEHNCFSRFGFLSCLSL